MATLKLTDTQRVILAAAGARDSGLVLPLPQSLRVNRGTQTIVLRGLLSKDFITTRPAMPDEEIWEDKEDGSRTTLLITEAGLNAVGIVPASNDNTEAVSAAKPRRKGKVAAEAGAAHEIQSNRAPTSGEDNYAYPPEPAKDTKLGILIAVLRRKKGATIADLMVATGWQAHSVRGAISGALKKRLKLEIVSETIDGRGRVYRIGGQPA